MKNILDIGLEETVQKPEFHIIVKRLLIIFFLYQTWCLGNFLFFLFNQGLWNLFEHFPNIISMGLLFAEMFAIYRIYNYKKQGVYIYIVSMLLSVFVVYINLLLLTQFQTSFFSMFINQIIMALIFISILIAILMIKKDGVSAWHLLK